MHSDLFRDKKGVHIKLDKDVHAAFRKQLFDHGVSMQAIFNEFARLIGSGNRTALQLLNAFIKRRLQDEIEKHKLPNAKLDELDHEALYNMISEEGSSDPITEEKDTENEDYRSTG